MRRADASIDDDQLAPIVGYVPAVSGVQEDAARALADPSPGDEGR